MIKNKDKTERGKTIREEDFKVCLPIASSISLLSLVVVLAATRSFKSFSYFFCVVLRYITIHNHKFKTTSEGSPGGQFFFEDKKLRLKF